MIKYIALMVGLFFSCTVFASSNDAVALTDVSKPLLVSLQQKTFIVRLSSNPTTGYQWFLKAYDPDMFVLKSHRFIANKTKLVGAPGVDEWTFGLSTQASKAPMLRQIIFVSARTWEPTENATTTKIAVFTHD